MNFENLTNKIHKCKIVYEPNTVSAFLNEHSYLIKHYPKYFPAEYININYTKKFIKNLPAYSDILFKIKTIEAQVFNELNNSSYFTEVWSIENKESLLVNSLILIYRTSILNLHPHLRDKSVQISSSLEELAAYNALCTGKDSLIFRSTKNWIKDYENEGFSKKLYDKLIDKELI